MLRLSQDGDTQEMVHTKLSNEGFQEEDLREWVIQSPLDLLGEDILIIGREVQVRKAGDALDLLGIDRDGKVVIIELKRGALRGTVDYQGIKYAAYTSEWGYDDLKNQYDQFKVSNWGSNLQDSSSSFADILDDFCNDNYTINQDQRLLLVGESIRERLDFVIRWLSKQSIDVSVVDIDLLKDDNTFFLDSERVIPESDDREYDGAQSSEQPWKRDGEAWHLRERASEETAEFLQEVVSEIEEIESLSEAHWNQKSYIAFKQARRNRVSIRTHQGLFYIRVLDVNLSSVDPESIAESLEIDSGTVTKTEQMPGSGRPGVQIECEAGMKMKVDALGSVIENML